MTEQGTQEWRDERAGHQTSSMIHAVLAKPKKGSSESTTRANYRARLICEILSGKAIEEEFESWDMKRGKQLEPEARSEYELNRKLAVETVGFVKHATIVRYGCSPDGYVGKDGLVQFKCPNRAKHMDWLTRGGVPAEHRYQMQSEMDCTGRQWSDFVSYNPDFPEHLQLFIVRLKRDESEIEEIRNGVMKFNAEIDEIIAKLPPVEGYSQDLTQEWNKNLEHIKAQQTA